MRRKGFYFTYEFCDEIGFSFNVLYAKYENDFQISLQLGTLAVAVGVVL